jgi:kinesin family protein 23
MFSKKIPAKGQQIKEIDKVKVFCLMRSLQNDNDISCIKTLSKATVSLTPPDTSVSFRNGNDREIHCSFHHVFEEVASHETIFEHTTLPLINDVFRGKNGLLFTYGLSGSGKTYTMTGEPQNTGIIPRSLDVIFSSVMHLQAEKFIFIPDKMNGFEVQSEEDAWKERQREINAYMKSARPQKLMRTYACKQDYCRLFQLNLKE